jgi:hypothetical protein
MRILLESHVSGDGPVTCREYSAEAGNLEWDERSPLPSEITYVIQCARVHAEDATGVPMVLDQLSIQCARPVDSLRCFYFTLIFQHATGIGEPVIVVLDLSGNVIEPEVTDFDDAEAYARYVRQKGFRIDPS